MVEFPYMKPENEFKEIVANNITLYRKANNLTQLQLAEKLNYSDKAISKWERGESLPDLYILSTIAEMFGITLNDLTEKQTTPKRKNTTLNKRIVTLLSIGLTWLVAFIVFVILKMAHVSYAEMTFIYALVAADIVFIVFSKLWLERITIFISVSLLYYLIPLAVCMQLSFKYNSALLFIIAIPLQILTILWFFRKHDKK